MAKPTKLAQLQARIAELGLTKVAAHIEDASAEYLRVWVTISAYCAETGQTFESGFEQSIPDLRADKGEFYSQALGLCLNAWLGAGELPAFGEAVCAALADICDEASQELQMQRLGIDAANFTHEEHEQFHGAVPAEV